MSKKNYVLYTIFLLSTIFTLIIKISNIHNNSKSSINNKELTLWKRNCTEEDRNVKCLDNNYELVCAHKANCSYFCSRKMNTCTGCSDLNIEWIEKYNNSCEDKHICTQKQKSSKFCTREYLLVCGYNSQGEFAEYSNSCMGCLGEGVVYIEMGPCPKREIE